MIAEGPAIAGIYKLFNAEERLRYVRFDFNHNYNQTSREAVYQWFGRWLLKAPDASSLNEVGYTKEPDQALRVWPEGKPGDEALPEKEFVQALVRRSQAQLEALRPRDRESLERFKKLMEPAWRLTGDFGSGKSSFALFLANSCSNPRQRLRPDLFQQVIQEVPDAKACLAAGGPGGARDWFAALGLQR